MSVCFAFDREKHFYFFLRDTHGKHSSLLVKNLEKKKDSDKA